MSIFEHKLDGKDKLEYFSGISESKCISFLLQIPRSFGVKSVKMHIYGDGLNKSYYEKISLDWSCLEGSCDIYKTKIDMSHLGIGLYYYKYEIDSLENAGIYGMREADGKISKLSSENEGLIQLLVYHEYDKHPAWLYGGIMYHIFVDRFKSSGKCAKKDYAVINEDWYNGIPQYPEYPGADVENNMFFGGDLYGIIEKLDYIKSLGVNCIYLSPIFDAYSNHKYDTSDYMSVDSMFGSEKALEELIFEAKKRDIYIILDGVFNHTGSTSIYFNKDGRYDSIGAYQSKNSPYYEWYNFKSYPDKYECWWDVQILPRVKSDTPSYKNFILGENGVIEKWMKKGIAGFRLDVADELSDDFLKTLSAKVKGIKKDGIVYGEVWEDASNKIAYETRKKYFLGNELDSVMNYPLREALVEYIKYGNSELLIDTFNMLYSHYPKTATDLLMNVLGTHDTERILTVLGGESSDGYTNEQLSTKKMSPKERKEAIKRLKLAFAVIATVPGIPCIYYGDEAGMEGYRDPFNRLPYPWGKEDASLLDFYKKISQIRVNEPLYKQGLFKIITCDENILSFARHSGKNAVITVVNRGESSYKINSNVRIFDLISSKKVNTIDANSEIIFKANKKIDEIEISFE